MKKINLNGIVGLDITANEFQKYLIDANGDDIIIEMNSPGGSIVEGIAIMNSIKGYKGNVDCNISLAASMGTQIASVCRDISVYDNAVFMIHNAQSAVYGDYRDMEKKATILKSYNKMLTQNYVKQTGKSEEEIIRMMDNETYMFGSEIVTNGFAKNIIVTDSPNKDANILKDITMTMVKSCNNKMNEKPESIEKLSACIATIDKNLLTNIENNVNSKKDDIIVSETKNKKGDSEMEKEIQDALQADRERCSAIMALGCSAEMAANAIKDGKSAGDVALEMVMASKKEKEINLSNFENSGKEINLDLDEPTKEVNKSAEQLALEADDEAFFNERRGK